MSNLKLAFAFLKMKTYIFLARHSLCPPPPPPPPICAKLYLHRSPKNMLNPTKMLTPKYVDPQKNVPLNKLLLKYDAING